MGSLRATRITSASAGRPSCPHGDALGHVGAEALGVDAIMRRDPFRLRMRRLVLTRPPPSSSRRSVGVKASTLPATINLRQRPVVAQPLQRLPDAPQHRRAMPARDAGEQAAILPWYIQPCTRSGLAALRSTTGRPSAMDWSDASPPARSPRCRVAEDLGVRRRAGTRRPCADRSPKARNRRIAASSSPPIPRLEMA
jgi:hypothetical protein